MELLATDHKRVLVGLGMTGLSCARYLGNRQKLFSVVDSREDPPCLEEFKKEFPEVELHLGEISDLSLRGANELVVSPGVALEVPPKLSLTPPASPVVVVMPRPSSSMR